MKRRNIFFSVIIVLTMILGMYPQNAFATEIQENIQNENQQETQVSNQEDQVAESSTQTVHQTKKDEAVTLSNDSYTVSTDEE